MKASSEDTEIRTFSGICKLKRFGIESYLQGSHTNLELLKKWTTTRKGRVSVGCRKEWSLDATTSRASK